MSRLRLAFMGTPDFAVPCLKALLNAGHDLAAVYCQPPRPAGRGNRLTPSPVQKAAEEVGLPVRHPASLKDPEVRDAFAALKLDAAVVVAYGLILPNAILEAPRLGCLNLHASLLPRWRGAAPIQRAILEGDRESGVTVMQMDEGLDSGGILLQEATAIGPRETGQSLHDRLAEIGAPLMVEALEGLRTGALKVRPQPDDGVTYAAKLTREEARLDWRKPAVRLERQVRAFTPWPGSWFELEGERIRVLEAAVAKDRRGEPGELLDDGLTIACGEDALKISRLQRAGREALDAKAFLRGFALPAGRVLP